MGSDAQPVFSLLSDANTAERIPPRTRGELKGIKTQKSKLTKTPSILFLGMEEETTHLVVQVGRVKEDDKGHDSPERERAHDAYKNERGKELRHLPEEHIHEDGHVAIDVAEVLGEPIDHPPQGISVEEQHRRPQHGVKHSVVQPPGRIKARGD